MCPDTCMVKDRAGKEKYYWDSEHETINRRGYTPLAISERTEQSIRVCSIFDKLAAVAEWTIGTLKLNDVTLTQVWYPADEPAQINLQTAIISLPRDDWVYPDILGHEYGHRVMSVLYQSQGIGPGEAHDMCAEVAQSGATAFSEGYATAFALISKLPATATSDVTFIWGQMSLENEDIEIYGCDQWDNLGSDEGRVAAALWDLYDSNPDTVSEDEEYFPVGKYPYVDEVQLLPTHILVEPLRSGYRNDIYAYWNALSALLSDPSQKANAARTLLYNWANPAQIPPPTK